MCEQLERGGLVAFDKAAVDLTLPIVAEDAPFSAGRTEDPCTTFYSLGIGGRSTPRTPGSYHKDLKHRIPNPDIDHSTRERMHPSIQLRIDANSGYFPTAFEKHQDWSFVTSPRWEFHAEKEPGMGAYWRRPEVPEKPGKLYGKTDLQREIKIPEHVIQFDVVPGKINFEVRLLPKKEREMLKERNEYKPLSPRPVLV
jgi:hypothetical protein